VFLGKVGKSEEKGNEVCMLRRKEKIPNKFWYVMSEFSI
jgi:hypothetical protein